MAWAALDRYLRGAEIPRRLESPGPGDPLHTELKERQVAALAGQWARISEWQSAPVGSWRDRLPLPIPMAGDDVASRVRREWRGLRRRLDAGEPVLLTLLLGARAYDRPKHVRQVLATGWSRNGWRVTLSIYDPDQPNDDDRDLRFDLTGPLNARLTGGAPIRGFIPVPYDRSPAPVIRAERFDDRSVIGLNRPVRGRPSTAAGRKHVAVVARNDQGGLIHFRRRRGGVWEGSVPSASDGIGVEELHSDPVAIHQAGALHVFARSYAGDLLHLRHRRRWSVTNCTEQKGTGSQYRLEGPPVPVEGAGFRLDILGRAARGGLVHYYHAPLRGWRAKPLPADAVAGDPVAIRHEGALHVVALHEDGRLLHWVRDDTWSVTDPEAGSGPRVRLQGHPALLVVDGRPHVFGRGRHNRLILLRLDDNGAWVRKALAGNLGGSPRVVSGPGGAHVLAPTADGGLIHAWEDGDEWTWEDVVESRATLTGGETGEAGITCWGSAATLRAFVQHRSHLRAYTWTPDGDWVSDPVTAGAGTPPVAFRDGRGDPHLVFTDGQGTIVHLETGQWEEPLGATRQGAALPATEESAPAGDGGPETVRDIEPVEPEVGATVESEDPWSLPGPDVGEDPMDPDVPELPGLEDPAEVDSGDPGWHDDEEWDSRPPAGLPGLPEVSRADADPTDDEWEPRLEIAEEADGLEEDESPPKERPVRRFSWDKPPAVAPEDVEPMDLSLLDSWPPPTRGPRSDQPVDPENGNGQDRDDD